MDMEGLKNIAEMGISEGEEEETGEDPSSDVTTIGQSSPWQDPTMIDLSLLSLSNRFQRKNLRSLPSEDSFLSLATSRRSQCSHTNALL